MSALPFRIVRSDGQVIGAAEYAEDAAALVALYDGATIRRKNRIVYRQGADGDAGESYDAVAELIDSRLQGRD